MKKHTRSLALLLAVIFALGCVSLAQALEVTNGSIVTTITNATVYMPDTSSATGTTMKALSAQIAAGTQLTVYGTNGNWIAIQVKDSASGTPYVAWIQAKDVTAGASGTTTGTITGATTGTPGIIVNCNSGVNMRSGAGRSSGSVTVVPKGATVSVHSSEKGSDGKTWYKVTYGATTGYIRSDYVSTTGTVSSGTGTPADTNTDGSGTSMVSLDNVIYMRKTASSSTSGATKLTGVRGKTFTILGESGSFYYASYGSNKGYVRKQDFSTGSSGSGATTGTAMTYAAVTGTSADRWGYIKQIPGTKIGSDFGKLYDNSIYCNGLNSKKTDYHYNTYSGSKNYFFSIAPQGVETSVISGHNMQQSQTGFHDLHHVQNALLGVSTCEESSCRANCSGAGATTFYINYAGKTAWQVVGFFEINQDTVASEATRKTIQSSTLLNFTLTGAQKQAWINQVMSYATSAYKGKAISNATSTDQLMVLYTCGDHGNAGARAKANGAGSSKGGYQNLYFLLKAVG